MQWVQSLGWEDPLEEETATHSSILVWKSPWTEEPGGLQSGESQRVKHSWARTYTVFPAVMYKCEWTIKKTESQRTDAFKLVLEKILKSSLDSKEIQPVHPKGDHP